MKYWRSHFIYVLCVFILATLKLTNLVEWKIFYKYVDENLVEKLFYLLFTKFSYHGFLLSDLERLIETGDLRARYLKKIGKWKELREFDSNKRKFRIGFFGVFGQESNFPKEFFYNVPENFEIIMYDLIRPNLRNWKYTYKGTKIFNNHPHIGYRKTPELQNYIISQKHYEELLREIELDQLDVFLFTSNMYALPLLDKMTVPLIVSMNLCSLLIPHEKCRNQSFIQPSWPYDVNDDRVFNIKKNKTLNFPTVYTDLLIFSTRSSKNIKVVPWEMRKQQIFFSGNLKKLYSKDFFTVIKNLMINNENLHLIYYGANDKIIHQQLINLFKQNEIVERAHYGGSYEQRINDEGQWIQDEQTLTAFKDLSESMLFLNTFPIGGARSCLEAYQLDVPVIHLDSQGLNWLNSRKLIPFHLPLILSNLGTASSVTQYLQKAQMVIDDADFAKNIITEQRKVLTKLTDPSRYWNIIQKVMNCNIN